MYNQNSEHKSAGAPPTSPRVSFSIDFVDPSSHSHSQSHARPDPYRDAPVSSDFAFSVGSNDSSMMSGADELFSKGRILPYKEGSSSCNNLQFFKSNTTTLRDELQNEEEDGDFSSFRPPKNMNPTRWRGLLGLRKQHVGSRKSDKYGQASVEKRGSFHYEDINNNVQCSKNSQESVE